MKTILITIAISLVIGGFIAWSIKPDKKCPEITNTQIEYRYIDKIDTVFIPKFYTKKDTIRINQLDTFFVETQYVAELDTTFEDSSLTANVKFISDIPLSEKSFFDMRFKVREKTITNTIIQTEEVGFWYKRISPYIGFGIGYDGKTVTPNINLSLGIRIN